MGLYDHFPEYKDRQVHDGSPHILNRIAVCASLLVGRGEPQRIAVFAKGGPSRTLVM